jgi:hypothetical protein
MLGLQMLQRWSTLKNKFAEWVRPLIIQHYKFVDLEEEDVISNNKTLCSRLLQDRSYVYEVSPRTSPHVQIHIADSFHLESGARRKHV